MPSALFLLADTFLVLPLLIYRNPLGSGLCRLSPHCLHYSHFKPDAICDFNVTELEALDCGSTEQERTMSELSRALCLN